MVGRTLHENKFMETKTFTQTERLLRIKKLEKS